MQRDTTELTYRDLLGIVRGSWIAILVMSVVGGLIAAATAYSMQPVYRSEALLSPASLENSGGSTLARLAEQFAPLSGFGDESAGGLAGKEVRIATLRSRRLTEHFIRDRKLLPVLFPKRWDSATRNWKVKDGEPSIPSMDEAMHLFDKDVRTVNEDRRTGLITLRIEWEDRRMAADWCNDLVSRANEYLRARTIGESQRSISFLENELGKTNVVERQQIIYRLIESKISEIMMANSRPEYAFVVVDPAVVPEHNNFVRPRRSVIAAIGLFLGIMAGVIYASVRWARSASRSAT